MNETTTQLSEKHVNLAASDKQAASQRREDVSKATSGRSKIAAKDDCASQINRNRHANKKAKQVYQQVFKQASKLSTHERLQVD